MIVYALVFSVVVAAALYVAASVFSARRAADGYVEYARQDFLITMQMRNAFLGSLREAQNNAYGLLTDEDHSPYSCPLSAIKAVRENVNDSDGYLWTIKQEPSLTEVSEYTDTFSMTDVYSIPGFSFFRDGTDGASISFSPFENFTLTQITERADLPFSPTYSAVNNDYIQGNARMLVPCVSWKQTQANSSFGSISDRSHNEYFGVVEEPISNYQLLLLAPSANWAPGSSGALRLLPNGDILPKALVQGSLDNSFFTTMTGSSAVVALLEGSIPSSYIDRFNWRPIHPSTVFGVGTEDTSTDTGATDLRDFFTRQYDGGENELYNDQALVMPDTSSDDTSGLYTNPVLKITRATNTSAIVSWTGQASDTDSLFVMDSATLYSSADSLTLYYGDPDEIEEIRDSKLEFDDSVNVEEATIDDISIGGSVLTLDLSSLDLTDYRNSSITDVYAWEGPKEIHISGYSTVILTGATTEDQDINQQPLKIVTDASTVSFSGSANYRRFVLIDTSGSTTTVNFSTASSSWFGALLFPYGASISGNSSSFYGTILVGDSLTVSGTLSLYPDAGEGLDDDFYTVDNQFTPGMADTSTGNPVPILLPRISWVFR